MIAARRAFCFFVSAMISPANPPGTKNETLAGSRKAIIRIVRAECHCRRPCCGTRTTSAQPTATLSKRFLRQSVAKGIDGMSHQYADAQNEGRSYNSK